MSNQDDFVLTKKLDHIALIMDGNGRWAKKRHLIRSLGHKAGVNGIKRILDACFFTYHIKVVSLFCFSTENWNRPEDEISFLFNLLKEFFENNIEEFKQKNIRLVVSGDLEDKRIPQDIKNVILKAEDMTKDCYLYTFNVLFNYGGRKELVHSFKKIYEKVYKGEIDISQINEQTIFDNLYHKELGNVDLLIRTSGEYRISNCLLYEIAYAEFIFTKTYWPDFDLEALKECLKEYNLRNRRYGGLKNE